MDATNKAVPTGWRDLPEPKEINGDLAETIMAAPCNWKGDPRMHDAVFMGHTMACEQGAILAMKYVAAATPPQPVAVSAPSDDDLLGFIESNRDSAMPMKDFLARAKAKLAARAAAPVSTQPQAAMPEVEALCNRIVELRAALRRIANTGFGWDGDCGVTTVAEDALYGDEQAEAAAPPSPQPVAESVPTYWQSQKKMIERAIIGLRDGWATRADADAAIAALNATPAAALQPVAGLTDADVVMLARAYSDRSAYACNVNPDDNWDTYGGEYIDDVKFILSGLTGQAGATGESK